ncbi:MAG TPA: LON peptidase substrate-binding domain-containing protein, partial [Armatimonadota bacterium]|nr:LON peptidase substrate-binding domain-containing protein [Armatimonadota bacterium]
MEREKQETAPDEPAEEPRAESDAGLRASLDAPTTLELGPVDEESPAEEGSGGAEPLEALPTEVSILPLRDNVLFPAVVMPMAVTRDASVKLIDDAAVAESRVIGIVSLRDPSVEAPKFADLYPVGVAAAIRMMVKMPDGVRLIVHGLKRIRLVEAIQEEPYIRCRVEVLEDLEDEGELTEEQAVEVQALARNLGSGFQRVVQMSPNLPDEFQAIPLNVREPATLADLVAAHMPIATAEKQEILEELDVHKRLHRLSALMQRELNVLEVGTRIQSEVSSEMSRMQREYFLREQIKAIQKELGEGDEREAEIQELRAKIEAAGMPEEARKEAERELERLQRMPPAAAEYTVARTYLDWLTALPWAVQTEDNLDIKAVRAVLDEDHYGLERIKDRILEYLAVRKFK